MIESSSHSISGIIYDLMDRRKFPGTVYVEGGLIADIVEDETVNSQQLIMPGLVDAHVHIESSMLVPSEFARLAVVHGTVATVSDPHEIANVCGIDGVRFMIENGEEMPFTFAFGAPSCVPATRFETAGAEITADDIRELFKDKRILYLSEMMNWPGILNEDAEVLAKIAVAKKAKRPVDGHAPGLKGADARKYAKRGISTDHECFTLEEALDKIKAGMKILIREGSAARNYDTLHTLLQSHPESIMFCCDDIHPDSLVAGHINEHVKRSLELGYNEFDVLRAASVHPVEHYKLPVGLLKKGDPADFIVVDNIDDFNIIETWIKGFKVADNGKTQLQHSSTPKNGTDVNPINNFSRTEITSGDIHIDVDDEEIRIIVAHDGQLVTTEEIGHTKDPDVLKIIVVNRYADVKPSVAFIKGMGLRHGAIASSVAHDSHNVIAVGCTDDEIVAAVNGVIAERGGISVAVGRTVQVLPLPVGGLMSLEDGYNVSRMYKTLDRLAKNQGSRLRAPFMTLSFMALLVIPHLKLSDKGLFDGNTFTFTELAVG
ncbi:MAG: adenine deaminase [Ignavibacteria bacterium]|nr:adenine deaminase [Ignavibacteria bacterium]